MVQSSEAVTGQYTDDSACGSVGARAGREGYVRAHAAEVARVEALFRETEPERSRNLLLAGDGR